jgi:transposase-like protein
VSRINEKLGLRPAGARARMRCLSGVRCPACGHVHVVSNVIHGRLSWLCGACGHVWNPTPVEVQSYNGRVRDRDRIRIP